jgi:AhpC/TSA antioxidant enzyme
VRDRIDDLGDAAVALVTFAPVRVLRGYRARLGLPFPVLADEDRAVYRAYGLGRGPWWRVWGWSTLRRYGQLLRRPGQRLQRVQGDTLQLGGDVVVGRDGRLVLVRRSTGPADRPPVDDLVAAVRRA